MLFIQCVYAQRSRNGMHQFFKIKIGILFFCVSTLSLSAMDTDTKKFQLKSGNVVYSIHGGGALTPDLNLTIVGEGRLRFRDWGKVVLLEEETEESTSGAFKSSEKFAKCIKRDRAEQYDVDYDQEIILERPIPKGKEIKNITAGMLPHGEDVIAGKKCKMWAKEGVRICLYKGIPLLVEKALFGIHFEKKALFVNENVDVDTEQCSIPDFPVQKIALFKTSIKQKKGPEEVSQHLSHLLDEIALKKNHRLKKMKEIYLNRLGEHIFQREKSLLPQMLESMKRARECLQGADDKLEANDCIEEVNDFRVKMVKGAKDENSIDTWDEKEKNRILDEFDKNIDILESRMQCIRAAKNITDLSGCMRK